jgi:uncharacterized protein
MRSRFVVILLALALGGCGSSPPTHFYTLDPVPARQSDRGLATGAPIEVGHVELPATLDRNSMVTGGVGDQLVVSDQNRWAAPLDELVRRALTQDLQARLAPGSVLAPGDPTRPGTRILVLNVQRFMANDAGEVTLETDWNLQRAGRPGPVRHESIRTRVEGRGGDAVAEAMSRALGELTDRIVVAM